MGSNNIMFSGNGFLYIFLVFLLLFILRYAYMRYYLRLQYRSTLPRPSRRTPANTVNMAPYFIRLSAMQDARVQARRREEMLRAIDLPPNYDDLVGYDNLAATDDKDQDMYLPAYSECVEQGDKEKGDWPENKDNKRPGRY